MQLIVHRGTNIKCPENSICGIREIRSITKDSIIEIDIVPTKDNKLVLHHDLSLIQTCNIDKLVFDFTLQELNELQSTYEFIELEKLLVLFPNQKFLLDIRCGYHIGFFINSRIDTNKITEDLFKKYELSIKKLNKKNIILSCSELSMAKRFHKNLNIDVELSENYLRDFLKQIERTSDISIIDFNLKKVNIQNCLLTNELVNIFHFHNIKVFSTPSLPKSIENSKKMIEIAYKYNCDGIWLSPINNDIINKLKNLK